MFMSGVIHFLTFFASHNLLITETDLCNYKLLSGDGVCMYGNENGIQSLQKGYIVFMGSIHPFICVFHPSICPSMIPL